MASGSLDPEAVAGRVADGDPVDWEGALRTAPGERERRVLGHLRLVESVARVHRTAGPPTWGPLELRERLGGGSFGEVYRAWDPRLEREVALKLLRTGTGAQALEEGRLLARLRHPHVVAVYGAEEHDGRSGLWMELVRGRSLEEELRAGGPRGAAEAAVIGIDLCRALAEVHRAGVVHRDIKADNVLREEGGRVVLTDFGSGVRAGPAAEAGRGLSGTPFYMAPELLRGAPAGPATDLYALGVLLFRLVTARFPVEARTWEELRTRHERREVRLLRDLRPDLPASFVRAVEAALAPDPAERPGSAGAMEQLLARVVEAAPAARPARRWAPRALAAGLLLAAALGSALLPSRGGFTVDAALYRVSPDGARQRLEPGARLAVGDQLGLEVRGSVPLHLYVVNEDEQGRAYALFPLPDLETQNPLPPGTRHVLPGRRRGGESVRWSVDSAGGRERLLLLASPERLEEFESELAGLARPGETAVALGEAARARLRGIGGLAVVEERQPRGAPGAGRLFGMAERLAGEAETVRGIWLRQVELENPGGP